MVSPSCQSVIDATSVCCTTLEELQTCSCGQNQWKPDFWSRRWCHSLLSVLLSVRTVSSFSLYQLSEAQASGWYSATDAKEHLRGGRQVTSYWRHHFLLIIKSMCWSAWLRPWMIGALWQEAAEKVDSWTLGAKLRPPVVRIHLHLNSWCAL